MRSTLLTKLAVFALLFCTASSRGQAKQQAEKVRIGTYDSRAIAMAYVASKFQIKDVAEKKAELDRAKAAGDEQRVREALRWGKDRQRQLHIQGFGRAVVADLLKPVEKGVAQVAASQKLVAVTSECDFHAEDVELVDVTDELVALYDPSPRTLQHVKEIRKVDPIPLAQVATMDENE
jgi:hypothetical protein